MDIKLKSFPKGPAGKFIVLIVAIYLFTKYCIEWLKRGLPNPLTPFTFTAVMLCMIIVIIAFYYVQKKPKKNKF